MSRQVAIVNDTLLHSSMPGHVYHCCVMFITTGSHCRDYHCTSRSLLENQVVAIITARPVVVLITARPVIVFITARPVVVLITARPVVVLNIARPVFVLNTARPVVVFNTARPVVVLNIARPVVVLNTARPVVVLNTARHVVVSRHVAINTLLRSSRCGPSMERSSLQASGADCVWWLI